VRRLHAAAYRPGDPAHRRGQCRRRFQFTAQASAPCLPLSSPLPPEDLHTLTA
jgi:hypothetical protein